MIVYYVCTHILVNKICMYVLHTVKSTKPVHTGTKNLKQDHICFCMYVYSIVINQHFRHDHAWLHSELAADQANERIIIRT